MSTDRELLELAAKAAGIEGEWTEWDHVYGDYRENGIDYGGRTLWNPLADDGDALRLAATLGMWVHIGKWHVSICGHYVEETCRKDPCAATRRAIVRAAAEIGRSMK